MIFISLDRNILDWLRIFWVSLGKGGNINNLESLSEIVLLFEGSIDRIIIWREGLLFLIDKLGLAGDTLIGKDVLEVSNHAFPRVK